ncbi:hypothetical protein [Pseudomonas syringae]|uniref:hypothetical protein n=1 Tax=Pseudomonas syringae TaxID=317 RepID=UPI000209A6E1|nr:hypothetical protein [Pseudomonas syringae]EGH74250.1 hypothetical protein PSYAR_27229 [Pseudomonas syringae pv. aceris str. M302273]
MLEEKATADRFAKGFLTWVRVRDLLVIAMVVVLTVRLCFMQVSVDLSSFNFTDLLSMFLAISAIALSAAFYFKADESSRGFYNNTYQFTKDVSEILGRIEAGFGERLKHIDEGYSGLSKKFDQMPFDATKSKTGERTKEAEIQEQEAQRQDIIEDLMRRAHVAGEEKTELVARLSSLSQELDTSREELSRLRAQTETDTADVGNEGFIRYLVPFLVRHYDKTFVGAPNSRIAYRFSRVLSDESFDDDDRQYMESKGFLRNGKLTLPGAKFISRQINRYLGS